VLTDHWNATLVLLVTALAAAPLTALAGFWRRTLATPVAIVTTAAAFAAALWGWAEGGPTLDAPWAPAWNLRLTFELDGLAALYSLLATGIGLAVVIYASRYIPLHLAHSERDQGDIVRFYGFLLLFMGAMVGLVMAQDLFLIFLFWDLTAISSYFLIGYDSEREDARASALMAFLITGISAVCFLIGALLLYSEYGTFALPDLMARTESSRLVTTAVALISAAALAKSAQAPLHFWLPRAMAAPTPVSAYLHSAAMVAAGVFLLGRVHPLLEKSDVVMNALVVIGFASMATGGCLALTRKVLKQLLAYSTISQYGYVVVMLGIGGADGAAAASFYVIAHALMKCALFLTAGAVTEATGQKALTGLGGLWRRMPLLAVGSGAAAAGLAALPLTAGFFKDELFFKAADHEGNPIRLLAVAGAALTFAYSWRFWGGIFAGPLQTEPKPLSIRLTAPVAVLGALVLLGGVWPHPFARLAEDAATVTAGTPVHIEVAYHLDSRVENVMAIAAIAVGLVLIFSRPLWQPALVAISTTTVRFGPERLYWAVLLGLNRLSDRMHRIEIHDLRGRVATILLPAGLLVGAGVAGARPHRRAVDVAGLALELGLAAAEVDHHGRRPRQGAAERGDQQAPAERQPGPAHETQGQEQQRPDHRAGDEPGDPALHLGVGQHAQAAPGPGHLVLLLAAERPAVPPGRGAPAGERALAGRRGRALVHRVLRTGQPRRSSGHAITSGPVLPGPGRPNPAGDEGADVWARRHGEADAHERRGPPPGAAQRAR